MAQTYLLVLDGGLNVEEERAVLDGVQAVAGVQELREVPSDDFAAVLIERFRIQRAMTRAIWPEGTV